MTTLASFARDRRELNSLYKDLLIGVTRFFRDPELFQRLEQEVCSGTCLAKVPADDEIRVWVAGCATGEEAYSLAILLHEALGGGQPPGQRQDFRDRRASCKPRDSPAPASTMKLR